jgi:hypothetical protein
VIGRGHSATELPAGEEGGVTVDPRSAMGALVSKVARKVDPGAAESGLPSTPGKTLPSLSQ